MSINYPVKNAFALTVDEVTVAHKTSITQGITQPEAKKRGLTWGANTYKTRQQKSLWYVMLQQFKSPIVGLLAAGSVVSVYFKDILDAAAIAAVIVINALIGFLMELQARTSMNALKKMDVILAKVIRDGATTEIAAEQLVPGDLVPLEAGDIVPADGRLVEVHRLQCDESSLTGESFPTNKFTEKISGQAATGDQHNMIFKGTAVINGNGKAIITGIAGHTQLGIITSLVESSAETATPLDKKLNNLSKRLIWVTLAMTAIFAISGIIEGKKALLIIETSIALAVAAIPEGLPIVATVALSYGMLLMARRNVIVKKLTAVETLGSTGIILTDKTGTLTENKINVNSFSFPEESIRVHIENNVLKFTHGPIKLSAPNFDKLLLAGYLCNNAGIVAANKKSQATLSGDPVEVALINLCNAAIPNVTALNQQYTRVAELPFNSDIMMMATLHKTQSGLFAAAKGSVERLLERCQKIQLGPTIKIMDEQSRADILAKAEKMAATGLRVLAFAYNEGGELNERNYLDQLIYIGMAGFIDPPRLDIKGAIFSCKSAGIKVVMITGDHPQTALNIARKVGLIEDDDKDVITGKELLANEKPSPGWIKKVLNTRVFARISPKQKLDIATIYQQAGNIVAMTGDGVNDAPALKKADVSIAMGIRGTAVAKETASIILKDDSFTSIVEAVARGREIFQNIQKFVIYLVSCNLSEIFIVTLLGIITPASTLLPLQILFLNMVTDIFPALALGLGTGDKTVMHQPPRDPKKAIITHKIWLNIALYAATITFTVVATGIYCTQFITHNAGIINSVVFVTLTFAQLFHVFNMSSTNEAVLVNEITRNKFIWVAMAICTGAVVLVFAVPQLRYILGLSALPWKLWLIAIIGSSFPLIVIQAYKLLSKKNPAV
ncbi:MAG: cation-transporting P-type ATPase [Mucilaginibacter sp.]